MIESAYRNILINADAVISIATGGVHFNAAPQNERNPRIVLTLITDQPEFNHDGPAGWGTGSMQVDCFAADYATAKQLAKATRDALNDAEGVIANSGGTEVGWIECSDFRDVPTVPLAGQATPTFGVSITADFMITSDN